MYIDNNEEWYAGDDEVDDEVDVDDALARGRVE